MAREPFGNVFEGSVLQESSKEQVSRLKQCHIFGIDKFTLWQEAGDFQVEECRRNDEEFGCLFESLGKIHAFEILDELIRHHGERNLGDVEFVL